MQERLGELLTQVQAAHAAIKAVNDNTPSAAGVDERTA
jgi:hypothetical protein